jgi:hypothetical protein
MDVNWEGVAELGWRANQIIRFKLNGYWDWDELTPEEKLYLELGWRSLPPDERRQYREMARAACDAYMRAVMV